MFFANNCQLKTLKESTRIEAPQDTQAHLGRSPVRGYRERSFFLSFLLFFFNHLFFGQLILKLESFVAVF